MFNGLEDLRRCDILEASGLRISRTLLRLERARATSFAACQGDSILINRVPAVGACATVHRNHLNASGRGNVCGTRVDSDK